MLSVPLPLTTAFAFSHPGGSLHIEEWPSHYTASRRQTGQLGLCHGSPELCYEQLLHQPSAGTD